METDMTTAQLKAALKQIRTLAAAQGIQIDIGRSRRGVLPLVVLTIDGNHKVLSVAGALAALAA